ncbi:hypothetical protein HAX54_009637 [Datura stramonium]|uniref:LOB domain-containing protein n=1 Tax=Datura stramonium TaxID=4076 RepID=A0ABS8TF42_DATST|nr:hypothetical protein [Datura stramonium]
MKESGRKQSAAPCAACKLLRRRCAHDCVFAPYFPADEPHKFASVHKVFGASNVNKMLQELQSQEVLRVMEGYHNPLDVIKVPNSALDLSSMGANDGPWVSTVEVAHDLGDVDTTRAVGTMNNLH